MDYAVYLLFRLAMAIFAILPVALIFRVGQFGGWVAWMLARPYRALAQANMRIAFGGEKTDAEIKQLARAHFMNLGANLLCAPKLNSMTYEQMRLCVEVENSDAFQAAISKGKGVVGVVNHIGNWELYVRMPELVKGDKFSTIYQKLGNKYIDAHVRKTRSRYSVEPFERKEGFSGPTKFLREGGVLGVLVDQHAGDAGVWTPLFGRLASTSPLAATLALRTGAALFPIAVYTTGVGRWKMVFDQVLDPAGAGVEQMTARINQVLERQIRVSPPDWFWVHNRWKTPRPKFLLSSYKRGIEWPDGFDPATQRPFRILIRSTNWLGDAVMSVPAVRAIKRGRPDARVTMLVPEKLADFWAHVAEVDEVITIAKKESPFAVAKKLRAHFFDVAVLFPNSLRTGLEVFLAGIPRRVGYAGHQRVWLLNQVVERAPRNGPPRHQMFDYLDLAHAIGAAREDMWPAAQPPIQPGPPEPTEGKRRLRLGLCPGAEYGPAKRWLPERYGAAAKIVQETVDCEWILFGVEGDKPVAAKIFQDLDGKCTNLVGKTTLTQLIDELRQCDLLLTNDTGTMHLAAFFGVPVVAIFGSTEPALTGPVGGRPRVVRHHVECSPCFLRDCPLDFRCMTSITADQVATAVLAELGLPQPQKAGV
ncbi:MAG: lipopolysaccharide heptosyltransferase II [Chthoniobacteraceae bacterium]